MESKSNDMEDDKIVSPAAGDDERVNEPNYIEVVNKVPQVEEDEEITVEDGSNIEAEGQNIDVEPSPITTSQDNDQRHDDDKVVDTMHEDDGCPQGQDDHETEVCHSGFWYSQGTISANLSQV